MPAPVNRKEALKCNQRASLCSRNPKSQLLHPLAALKKSPGIMPTTLYPRASDLFIPRRVSFPFKGEKLLKKRISSSSFQETIKAMGVTSNTTPRSTQTQLSSSRGCCYIEYPSSNSKRRIETPKIISKYRVIVLFHSIRGPQGSLTDHL